MEAARPATTGDLPRLVELCRMARQELAPTRGGALLLAREARRPDVADSLASDLDRPDRGLWAGTINGTIVGYSAGHVERLADGAARLGVIDDLFVEPGARAVGVGEAMMEAMLAWFLGQGCRGVDALALPGNRATKNFFEESGFTARLLVMHRKLEGPKADDSAPDG